MFGIRGPEILIILVIVILLFGAAKIPELARSVGTAMTEFRKGVKGAKDEMKEATKDLTDTEEEAKNS